MNHFAEWALIFLPGVLAGFVICAPIVIRLQTQNENKSYRIWMLEAALRNVHAEAAAALKETGDE